MKLHFSEQAIRDRRRLAAFLVDHNPAAALRAAKAIMDGVSRLSDTPQLGREIDGYRELHVRFGASGYVVQYRIDENTIVVARIFHMREAR